MESTPLVRSPAAAGTSARRSSSTPIGQTHRLSHVKLEVSDDGKKARRIQVPVEIIPEESGSVDWQNTNEAVRDAHRDALEQQKPIVPKWQSMNELRSADEHMARASVGYASDLTKPGGFRRAHIEAAAPEGAPAVKLAPLVVDLETIGFNDKFVTEVVQTFQDGTR